MAMRPIVGGQNPSLDISRVGLPTQRGTTEVKKASETAAVTANTEIGGDEDVVRLRRRVVPLRPGATTGAESSEAATEADAELVGYLDLDGLLEIAGLPAAMGIPPHQCIAEFTEPRIADPAIFQGGRPLSILEQLSSDVIPTFDENEELRSLAGTVIEDEIDRHRELAARIHSGIPS